MPSSNLSNNKNIPIKDSQSNILTIQIRDHLLIADESFECVTLSARYDHGFGFSQLFRFVDEKKSKEIEAICDASNAEVVPKFLPLSVSNKWRVLVTPVIKSNESQYADFYKQLMLDVVQQAQSILASKLLFSQFGRMFTYKVHHFEGVIRALNELKQGSFGCLEIIRFEVDSKHSGAVLNQFTKGLG